MKTKVTIKKYPDGTSGLKKVVGKKSKDLDTYTRETTTTYETSPGSKGKLYIKKGTVQRKPAGKGTEFIADDDKSIRNSTGKVVDPKSKKVEADNQATLRKMALDTHKDVDLSKRYKEGDMITYGTRKGTQVAGKVQKTADVPPQYTTETQKEIEVRRKGGVVPYLTGTKEQQAAKRAELESQGYYRQPGTNSYIKDDESIFIPEGELSNYEKKGYSKSAQTKENLSMLKKGAKKMKLYKKGAKKC